MTSSSNPTLESNAVGATSAADANLTSVGQITDMPTSSPWYADFPDTHVPSNLANFQLLGSSKNTLFWPPPKAGNRQFFGQLWGYLTGATSQEGEENSEAAPIKLIYSSAKEAADARRGSRTAWELLDNPTFPTTDRHDQLYVTRLFRACSDFRNISSGDSEDALKKFTKILQEDPARVEQACWSVLEEVKLRHIANGNEYRASGSFKFAGEFDKHITALCDDLFAINKTACKTICSNCNGLAAIVGQGQEAKKAQEGPASTTMAADENDDSTPATPAAPVASVVTAFAEQVANPSNIGPALTAPEEHQSSAVAAGPAPILDLDGDWPEEHDLSKELKRKRGGPLEDVLEPQEASPEKKRRGLPATPSKKRRVLQTAPGKKRQYVWASPPAIEINASNFQQQEMAPNGHVEQAFGGHGPFHTDLPPVMAGSKFADWQPPVGRKRPLSDATLEMIGKKPRLDTPVASFAGSGVVRMDASAAALLPESIASSDQRPIGSNLDSPGGLSDSTQPSTGASDPLRGSHVTDASSPDGPAQAPDGSPSVLEASPGVELDSSWLDYHDQLFPTGTGVPPTLQEQTSGAGAVDGADEFPDWDDWAKNGFQT